MINRASLLTIMALVMVATVSAALNESLVMYVPFDNSSLTDYALPGRTLTNSGASFVSGKVGGAADFESGESDKIIFTASGMPTGNSNRSMCAWVNIESTGAHHMFIGYGTKGGTVQQVFHYYYNANNSICTVDDNNLVCGYTFSSTASWAHFCMTYNATSGITKFYLNATTIYNASDNGYNTLLTTPNGQFGAENASGTFQNFHDGLLDEFKVWNRTITPEEVSSDYNSGNGCGFTCMGYNASTPAAIPNSAPNINLTYPAHQSTTDNATNTTLIAYVNDADNNTINVTFYGSNASPYLTVFSVAVNNTCIAPASPSTCTTNFGSFNDNLLTSGITYDDYADLLWVVNWTTTVDNATGARLQSAYKNNLSYAGTTYNIASPGQSCAFDTTDDSFYCYSSQSGVVNNGVTGKIYHYNYTGGYIGAWSTSGRYYQEGLTITKNGTLWACGLDDSNNGYLTQWDKSTGSATYNLTLGYECDAIAYRRSGAVETFLIFNKDSLYVAEYYVNNLSFTGLNITTMKGYNIEEIAVENATKVYLAVDGHGAGPYVGLMSFTGDAPTPLTYIGSSLVTASGNASVFWSGLIGMNKYSWYARATDNFSNYTETASFIFTTPNPYELFISVNSPANNTQTSNLTIHFNFNISHIGDLSYANCSLLGDGSSLLTATNLINIPLNASYQIINYTVPTITSSEFTNWSIRCTSNGIVNITSSSYRLNWSSAFTAINTNPVYPNITNNPNITVSWNQTINNSEYNIYAVIVSIATSATPNFVVSCPNSNNNGTFNCSFGLSDYSFNTTAKNTYYWATKLFISGAGAYTTSYTNFTYDPSLPTITINQDNEFTSDGGLNNGSSRYDDKLKINLTFTDDNLLSEYKINITNYNNGSQMYYTINSSVNLTNYNFSNDINISSWASGYYAVYIEITDGATNKVNLSVMYYRGKITTVPIGVALLNTTTPYSVIVTESVGVFDVANITINGTYYNASAASSFCVGLYCEYNRTYSANVTAPISEGNYTFTWFLNYTDTSGVITSENVTDTVYYYDWIVNDCSGISTVVRINISSFDEDYPTTPLNQSMEVYGNYTYNNFTFKTLNLSFTSRPYFQICAYPNVTYLIDFYAVSTASGGFTHRFYLQNASLPFGLNNYSIYNYNDTTGKSRLQITARNRDTYSYYENLLGVLQRFYVSEGVWRSVQMDRSGDYGLMIFNIKELTTDYRLAYYDNVNHLLLTTQTVKFACSSGVCEATQLISPYSATTTGDTLSATTVYDNATKVITSTWTSSSASGETVAFVVTHETMTGQSVACSDTQTGNGGVFTCNVTPYNSAFLVALSSNGAVFSNTLIEKVKTKLADSLSIADQSIYGFMLMITVVALGLFSPVATLISSVVGMLVIFFFGIVTPLNLTLLIIGTAVSFVLAMRVRT